MAIFLVKDNALKRLLKEPESGMGYQILRYQDYGLVVLNATIAIPLEELRQRRFKAEEYSLLSGDPEQLESRDMVFLSLEDEFEVSFSILDPKFRTDTFGMSFQETVVEPPESAIPNVPQSYYRFCAYYKDRRVDSNGNFLPGTYATTYPDLHFVPSGFAAVGRYALPNPASARYVFSLVTFDKPTLMGTAAPNFGQAGGGVEVLFGKGAKNLPGASFPVNIG